MYVDDIGPKLDLLLDQVRKLNNYVDSLANQSAHEYSKRREKTSTKRTVEEREEGSTDEKGQNVEKEKTVSKKRRKINVY